MGVRIADVQPHTPAGRGGLRAGHTLLRVNGHAIDDVLDYRFYITSPLLALDLLDEAGAPYSKTLRKRSYEDLGLEFDTGLMDEQKTCRNQCVFCFIDQMPPGLRSTLYVKDDDSRMSFLFGNYITLTNLRQKDIERILAMHISPINISVHTTNPQLRVAMMKNRKAGEVLRYLPMLTGAGLWVNTQIVLCPGINDGAELERSLRDLCALAPNLQSVSVVPVGLTKYREGLTPMRPFTAQEARKVLECVEGFAKQMMERHGEHICYAADEFYLLAGRPFPPAADYGSFEQLENGVGLVSLLREEFEAALREQPARARHRHVTIATGQAAAATLSVLAKRAQERYAGLHVEVVPIINHFFGPEITVAGLVCGGDLLAQLHGRALGDALLFPQVMLRHEGDLFLDDLSRDELEEKLGIPTIAVPNDGYALLDAMLGVE
jgi:Fe-S oxidoreductase, related to NifB/MoaA family